MGIVRSSSWRRLIVSLIAKRRAQGDTAETACDEARPDQRQRERQRHSLTRAGNQIQDMQRQTHTMRHARKQASKQASKSRSRRKLPQLSQVSQLSQLQLRSMARGGLDPWCCRLVVPSPAINCPVRSGSQGLGLVFLCRWCAVYRVVWPEIRSSQRFAVWVCGCPRSRVAQATASKRWMVASVEESRHGPCSVYFPQLCSRAAGLHQALAIHIHLAAADQRKGVAHGASAVARHPLCFSASASLQTTWKGPPNEPDEPKQGHPEAQSRPSRAPFAGPSRCSFVPSVLNPV